MNLLTKTTQIKLEFIIYLFILIFMSLFRKFPMIAKTSFLDFR